MPVENRNTGRSLIDQMPMDCDVKGLVSLLRSLPDNDEDAIVPFVGDRRVGKSSAAFQVARKVNPKRFGRKFIVFSLAGFKKVLLIAKQGDVIVVDEAVKGFWSTDANTSEGKECEKLLAVCGEKNLIVFICCPDYKKLLGGVKLAARLLVEVPKRGFMRFFRRNQKRQFAKSNFPGYQERGGDKFPDPKKHPTPPKWQATWRGYLKDKKDMVNRQGRQTGEGSGYLEPEPDDVKALAKSIRPILIE